MTQQRIRDAMALLPDLNDFGIGLYAEGHGCSPEENRSELAANRERLLQSAERFEAACKWIAENITPIKSINERHSSYGLKHIAEKDIGYLTNGVFIAAAVSQGYKFKISTGSPNVKFNMSEKSIKRVVIRQLSSRGAA